MPSESRPEQKPDPFDDLVDAVLRAVPRHLWVVIATILLMIFLGRVLTKSPVSYAGPAPVPDASSQTLEGKVIELLPLLDRPAGADDPPGPLQRLVVEITSGSQAGKRVEIDYGDRMVMVESSRVSQGEHVLLEYSSGGPMGDRYAISDFVRLPSLLLLVALFALATVAVGQWIGLRALISIGITLLALAGLIIPGIMAGHAPVPVALAGAWLLMTASLYLIYQWRWKTHVALAAVTLSLLFSSAMAAVVADFAHLTGLGSEDTALLLGIAGPRIDVHGLLLAGILIGAVGVLDDVTVSQASATFELKRANPALGWRQLFTHGMVIGRDHIASMVNTLLLAYAGASLPLFLLLATQNLSLVQMLNREFIAEEIVRTLVGSLGLIVAVPLTSLFASLVAQRWSPSELQGDAEAATDSGRATTPASG